MHCLPFLCALSGHPRQGRQRTCRGFARRAPLSHTSPPAWSQSRCRRCRGQSDQTQFWPYRPAAPIRPDRLRPSQPALRLITELLRTREGESVNGWHGLWRRTIVMRVRIVRPVPRAYYRHRWLIQAGPKMRRHLLADADRAPAIDTDRMRTRAFDRCGGGGQQPGHVQRAEANLSAHRAQLYR